MNILSVIHKRETYRGSTEDKRSVGEVTGIKKARYVNGALEINQALCHGLNHKRASIATTSLDLNYFQWVCRYRDCRFTYYVIFIVPCLEINVALMGEEVFCAILPLFSGIHMRRIHEVADYGDPIRADRASPICNSLGRLKIVSGYSRSEHQDSTYHIMNSAALLNQMLYLLPVIQDTSLVNLIPNRLERCNSVLQFEGPDVLVCDTDVKKKCWNKNGRPPPVVECATRELLVALSPVGSLLLDRDCDPAIYSEALLRYRDVNIIANFEICWGLTLFICAATDGFRGLETASACSSVSSSGSSSPRTS